MISLNLLTDCVITVKLVGKQNTLFSTICWYFTKYEPLKVSSRVYDGIPSSI